MATQSSFHVELLERLQKIQLESSLQKDPVASFGDETVPSNRLRTRSVHFDELKHADETSSLCISSSSSAGASNKKNLKKMGNPPYSHALRTMHREHSPWNYAVSTAVGQSNIPLPPAITSKTSSASHVFRTMHREHVPSNENARQWFREGSSRSILRKKSFYEQEDVARAKAAQLSDEFEVDQFKDMTLNKRAIFAPDDGEETSSLTTISNTLQEVTKFTQQECNRIFHKSWNNDKETSSAELGESSTCHAYIHGSGWIYPNGSNDDDDSMDENVENFNPVSYKHLVIGGQAGRSTINHHYGKSPMKQGVHTTGANGKPLKNNHPYQHTFDASNARSSIGGAGNFGVVYDDSRLC
jgi:hypothetical protein